MCILCLLGNLLGHGDLQTASVEVQFAFYAITRKKVLITDGFPYLSTTEFISPLLLVTRVEGDHKMHDLKPDRKYIMSTRVK